MSGWRMQGPRGRAGAVAVLLVLVVGCGGAGPAAVAVTAVPAAIASPAPALVLPLQSGQPWSLADAAGRVTVLDVWATYCTPCRASFPKLDRLAADRPDVVVVGVSVDEDDAAVTRFLAEVPAGFLIARDRTLSVQEPPWSVAKLPTLIVLDRQGRVRFRADELAEAAYDQVPALVDALRAE
jgi:thiol-disulfide isomerase/thioredoxin